MKAGRGLNNATQLVHPSVIGTMNTGSSGLLVSWPRQLKTMASRRSQPFGQCGLYVGLSNHQSLAQSNAVGIGFYAMNLVCVQPSATVAGITS